MRSRTRNSALLWTAVLCTTTTLVVALPAQAAGARPTFQLPFPCGQAWTGGSYPGHAQYAIDFNRPGDVGDPILASEAGSILEARFGVERGNFVIIDHGSGWTTHYLHMVDAPDVRQGQQVTRGQLLGRVGNTGQSDGDHLHYEQRADGTIVQSHFDGVPAIITADRDQTFTSANCGAVSGWVSEDLGGKSAGGPAVTSRGPNNLDVFVVGVTPDNTSNGALHNRRWPSANGEFTPWRQITGSAGITSDPSAASWNPNRIDVVARGPQGQVLRTFTNNAGAATPTYSTLTAIPANPDGLGAAITGAPALVSQANERLNLFARDAATNKLIHTHFNGTAWAAWTVVGGDRTVTSAPAATSWADGRVDVFARGTGNQLQQITYSDGAWHPWTDHGGQLTSDPDVTSGAPNTLTVVARGLTLTNGQQPVYQRTWNNGWSDWTQIAATNTNAHPAIAAWGGTRLDLFHRDPTDNSLTHHWRNS